MAIPAGGDDNRPVTQPGVSLYDRIRPPADQRTVRRLPALVARAVRLVRHAGGRVFWASVAVQLLAGGVVVDAGFVRMTLTPRVVNAARHRLVLATGSAKAGPVSQWLLGDTSLPIQRVRRTDTVVVLDQAAAALLPAAG